LFNFKKLLKLVAIFISFDRFWYCALFRYRVAPAIEHIALLRTLDVSFVIDIGANRGQFCLAALQAFPDARVVCFEPLESAYRVLSKVLYCRDGVTLHNLAIGNVEAQMVMQISEKEDSSSLLEISDLQNEIFPGTARSDSTTVVVSRLSKYLADNSLAQDVFIKIDVQGYELEVLRGAAEVLDRIQYIYVECSFLELYKNQAVASDIIDYLANYGFSLGGVYNLCRDKKGVAVQADFLFVNKEIA